MQKKMILAAILAVSLGGCATSYKPDGYGGGYSDVQLAENSFRIAFKGNDATSRTRAEDFALLRAADVALIAGFKFFTITDARSSLNYSGTIASGGVHAAVNEPEVAFTITCYVEVPAGAKSPINAGLARQSIAAKYGIQLPSR